MCWKATGDWFEWAVNQILHENTWERPSLLVITANGRAFSFVSEQSRFGILAELETRNIWVDNVTFFSEWPGSDRKWLLPQWPEMVADVLTAEGLARARIAVDASHGALQETAKLLPDLQIVPAGVELNGLRLVKHEGEIVVMRQALGLCDWMMGHYREEIRPGRLIDELDYSMAARMVVEAARRFAGEHFTITKLYTQSGPPGWSKGDRAPTGRVIKPNATAIATLVVRLNSMTTELTRPFLVGRDPQLARLFDGALAAQEAAAEQAFTGNPICAMHAAAQRVLNDVSEREGFGDWLQLRMGHPIGQTMHEFPSDTATNERPLIEHELYSLEPGLYPLRASPARFADPYWITSAGAEQISTTTKDRAWFTLD